MNTTPEADADAAAKIHKLTVELRELADLFEHAITTPGYPSDANAREEAYGRLEMARDALASTSS